jgi:hypothetical protein
MGETQVNANSRRYEIDGTEVQRMELETNANRAELPEKTGVKHGY